MYVDKLASGLDYIRIATLVRLIQHRKLGILAMRISREIKNGQPAFLSEPRGCRSEPPPLKV